MPYFAYAACPSLRACKHLQICHERLSQHHLQVNFEAIMTSIVSAANQP